MSDWVQAVDAQAWIIIQNGDVSLPKTADGKVKETKDYGDEEFKILEKNAKARQLLTNALSIEDSTRLANFSYRKTKMGCLERTE